MFLCTERNTEHVLNLKTITDYSTVPSRESISIWTLHYHDEL